MMDVSLPIRLDAQDVSSYAVNSQLSPVVEHFCFSSFDEEIYSFKNRMDCLSTTLSECASHSLKIKSLCCKKKNKEKK